MPFQNATARTQSASGTRARSPVQAEPIHNEVVIPRVNEAILVDLLYGISSTRQPADLETEFSETQSEVGENYVPIGHDQGGNYFLLALKGADAGKVYYWDASRAFDISSDRQNTYFICNSIDELLSILK
jgi:hypothetical protein